jgi:adenylate cyclase
MQQMAHGLNDAWRIGFQAPLEDTGVNNVIFSDLTLGVADPVRKTWPAFLYGLFWRHMCAAVIDDPVVVSDYATAEAEVTILFVDLVEFTRLSQRVDFAELSGILGSFERVAAEVALQFQGRLVKLLGDGAMFQFVHRNRAIEAGVAFVGQHPELTPRRAGLATGRAVSRQADFFGPVVNLAARLSSVAAPGELVVDAPPANFASEPADPVVLKGYDEPVTPYRVVTN